MQRVYTLDLLDMAPTNSDGEMSVQSGCTSWSIASVQSWAHYCTLNPKYAYCLIPGRGLADGCSSSDPCAWHCLFVFSFQAVAKLLHVGMRLQKALHQTASTVLSILMVQSVEACKTQHARAGAQTVLHYEATSMSCCLIAVRTCSGNWSSSLS